MQERYRSWLPHGFDFLNKENTQKRIYLETEIRKIFVESGYQEISPPILDYAATFQLTTRHARRNPTFQFKAGEGEQLAIRSDLTVQVIKAAANGVLSGDFLNSPQRFFYIQPVFHDHSWGAGHKREILQAGVELLNTEKENRVTELLQLVRKCVAIEKLQPNILYGDVRVIEQLLQKVPRNIRSALSLALHNKDTVMIHTLCQQAGLERKYVQLLTEMPLLFGDKEVVQKLKEMCNDDSELFSLFQEAEGLPGVIFDFSLVRELSYYTGPVFEAYIDSSTEKIFTGGIYDDLFSEFSDGKRCSACGFALNLSLMIEKILHIGYRLKTREQSL